MGGQQTGAPAPAPAPPAPAPAPAPPAPQQTAATGISQEEMNRIAAREKSQGQAEKEREIAEKFGVSVEEAERIVKDHRESQDKLKSEAERDREAAAREKAEAERAKTDGTAKEHLLNVKLALVDHGVKDATKLDKIAKLVDVENGADGDKIKAAIEALSKDMPELFGQPDPNAPRPPAPPAPPSDPNARPPAPRQGDDDYEKAKERGRQSGGSRGSWELPGIIK